MRILIDENLPRYLKRVLSKYDVQTVQDMGWHGVKNGTLLNFAESVFDIFLTADKNLPYQQNLSERQLSIVVFPSNKLSVVKSIEEQLKVEIRVLKAGDFIEL